MLYWLFTEGRALANLVIVPSGVITLLLTLFIASRDSQSNQNRVQWIAHIALSLAVMSVFVIFLGEQAIQRGRNTLPIIPQILVGSPSHISGTRLLSFSLFLLLSVSIANLILAQQLKSGSALREWLKLRKRPYSKRGEVGSSHFCTQREFARFCRFDEEGILLQGAFWGERNQRLDSGQSQFCLSAEDATRGILALGSPGSGKSQAIILPIIAQRMQSQQSLIVADPQGELTLYILQMAAVTGHTVAIHDPTRLDTPRFNLADKVETVSDARAIANVLVARLPGENQFWSEIASSLLAGCLLRFKSLGDIFAALSDANQLAEYFKSKDDDARELANSFLASTKSDGKVAANTLATLGTALTGWASATVRDNTTSSDFSANLLLKRPSVIVLTCPGRMRQVYAPYLGAVLRRLMLDLDTLGEQNGGSLPKPVTVVMDEFPALGHLDSLVADINLIRKRRIAVVIAAQTKAQLQYIYGPQGAEVLLSGLATQIVFGGCDTHTATYYSQASGQASVKKKNEDYERSRPLLTPDEVQSPPRGNCLIFVRYTEVDYAAQVILAAQLRRFYEDKSWQKHLRENDISRLILLPRRERIRLLDIVPAMVESTNRE